MEELYATYRKNPSVLLSHLTAKKNEAFDFVFHAFGRSVYFYSDAILGDPELSEDVLQDTFIQLWKHGSEFRSLDSVKAFLYRTAKHRCLDLLRHSKVKEKHDRAAMIEMNKNFLEDKLIEEEMLGEIYRAVEELPQECRKIFKLYLEGKTNLEIAEIFSISINTVKTQKYRAMNVLKEKIGEAALLILLAGIEF